MRPLFILVPLLLPRLSDKAAAQLLDFLAQAHDCAHQHYGPQAERWRRRQRRLDPRSRLFETQPLFDDDPPF